jgi:hypothetical protein
VIELEQKNNSITLTNKQKHCLMIQTREYLMQLSLMKYNNEDLSTLINYKMIIQ